MRKGFIVVAAVLIAAACGGNGTSSPVGPGPNDQDPPPPPPPPASGVTEVSMSSNAFVPSDVTIAVNGTVRWRNTDVFEHNTTSSGPGWSSGTMGNGATFEHTFAQAGTFEYSCTLHDGMNGIIRVQ